MTRVFSVVTSLALGACMFASAPSQAAVELQGMVPAAYNYKLSWSENKRVLTGLGRTRVVNLGPGVSDEVWLRVRPNAGSRVETLVARRGATIKKWRADGSMVLLKLRSPIPVGGSARISFRLRLKVGTENTSLGRSAGIELFGDALPVVAVAGARGLRMGPEPSYGEGSVGEVANWRLELTVPTGLRALLPGEQWIEAPSGGKYWIDGKPTTYRSEARVRDVAFAIGRYTSRSQVVGRTRVQVVASAQLKAQLPAALKRAVYAFSMMQRWYGGYHLPALKIVLGDLEFGGSEYPGLVFSTPDNATIAHEVAHQWFYGIVGNDQYNDPFLDESLTAFSEQRFHKSYRCNLASPIDGRAHGLGTGMSFWEKHPDAYEHTIYRGGACALTVLQRDLGSDVFNRALRAYVVANADKIAGVDDFLAAIRNAAPWYDLARWERLVGLS